MRSILPVVPDGVKHINGVKLVEQTKREEKSPPPTMVCTAKTTSGVSSVVQTDATAECCVARRMPASSSTTFEQQRNVRILGVSMLQAHCLILCPSFPRARLKNVEQRLLKAGNGATNTSNVVLVKLETKCLYLTRRTWKWSALVASVLGSKLFCVSVIQTRYAASLGHFRQQNRQSYQNSFDPKGGSFYLLAG